VFDGVRLESERDRDVIEVDGEPNIVTDRRLESHDESSNNVVISTSQFHEFMNAVLKEFEDLKDKMRSENTKLSENISSEIEVPNKNLSESLTRQFREESESIKTEIANKLKSDISNLTEAMDQLHKDTDLEVTKLRDSMKAVHEKLGDKMNENMSVVQRQIEKFLRK
jgi:phosphoglycerate-specific signal transduction histidine kinase